MGVDLSWKGAAYLRDAKQTESHEQHNITRLFRTKLFLELWRGGRGARGKGHPLHPTAAFQDGKGNCKKEQLQH